MKELLRKVKLDVILGALLYIVLGIVALVIPDTMIKILGYLIGILLILVGAVSMICYLLREVSQNYNRNEFGYGLVSIAVGILFLYKIEWIISLVPVILGIMVLASGGVKLQHVIDMKRMGYGNWMTVLILAVINVVLGVVLVVNPFETVVLLFQLVGAGLIFSGITDCVTAFYVAGRVKEFMDSLRAVDSSFVEVVDEDKTFFGRKRTKEDLQEQNGEAPEEGDGTSSEKVEDEGAEV